MDSARRRALSRLQLMEAESRTEELMAEIAYSVRPQDLKAALRRPVTVLVPDKLAEAYDVQSAIFTFLNEAARLGRYSPPIVVKMRRVEQLGLPLLEEGDMQSALTTWLGRLPYKHRIDFETTEASQGHVEFLVGDRRLSIAADGWCLHLNRFSAAPWYHTNAMLAGLAGTLALSGVMKTLLAPVLSYVVNTPPLTYNLWHHAVDRFDAPVCPESLYLDNPILVGAGGIGSAVIWALALADTRGTLSVVDDDRVDSEGTNLNRILYATSSDVDVEKVEIVKRVLNARGGPQVLPFAKRWNQFVLEDRPDRMFPLVIGGVDEDLHRWDIQGDLPKLYFDAGTGHGNWRVSQHDVATIGCVHCLTDRGNATDTVVAGLRSLGVLDAAITARSQSGTGFAKRDLKHVSAEIRGMLEGRSPQEAWDTYRRSEQCGQTEYQRGQHGSAPHLSATPGFILAAELLKRSLALSAIPERWNQIRGHIHGRLHARTANIYYYPHCDWCSRPDVRSRYLEKWG